MSVNNSGQLVFIRDLTTWGIEPIFGRTGPFSWTGNSGQSAVVTYSFNTSQLHWNPSDLSISGVTTITTGVQNNIKLAMSKWASFANIDFQATASNPNLVFAEAELSLLESKGITATKDFSSPSNLDSVDIYFDNDLIGYNEGGSAFETVMHEIGHSLGLSHPGGGEGIASYTIDTSIMSYNNGEYVSAGVGGRQAITPMLYDIAAIQFLYGANFNYNKTDTNYTFTGNNIARTIWDGGGVDTLDASTQTSSVTLDLREGFDKDGKQYVSKVGQEVDFNAYHTNIENAKGGSGDDFIYGNDKQDASGEYFAFNGNNKLEGGGGSDHLYGGKGNDTLTGGAGDDRFIINSGDGYDVITDGADGDRAVVDGVVIEGLARGTENGVLTLAGAILQLNHNDNSLTITAKDTLTSIRILDFLPAGYDGKSDYTKMGITIPAEKHELNDDGGSGSGVNSSGGDIQDISQDLPPHFTPIVLDLGGDAIQYITYFDHTANVHFDIDNDGFAEGLEWINPNDAFLVRDLNANGKIDNQKEMFGDDSGTTAYYKLAQYDTNHDNKVDAGDSGFAGLRIWQDLNSDGRTDAANDNFIAMKFAA